MSQIRNRYRRQRRASRVGNRKVGATYNLCVRQALVYPKALDNPLQNRL
jgi:hypothetical protein